jgi:signal transduction histidine kinase
MAWRTDRRHAFPRAVAALVLALGAGAPQAQLAVVEAYQDDAGLTSMATSCLAQSPDGVMWICTENGLFRFDGFRIHAEPLPPGAADEVSEAVADRLGRLWVATDTGVFVRVELQGAVRWLAVSRPDGRALRVWGKQRLDVDERGTLFAMDDASQVWTVGAIPAGARGLVAAPLALPPHESFAGRFDAPGGPLRAAAAGLWFGCGRGLCLWSDGRLRTWGPDQGLPAGMWGSLLVARDGSVWARSSAHLARLAPGAASFAAIEAPAATLWEGMTPLAEDRGGALLTATDDGAARWDGREWRRWTPRDGLPETAVRALLVDAEGELWMGTAGRGLHRWVGYGLAEHWTPAAGLPSPVVWSIARDGLGRLCVATSRGVACLDEATRRFASLGPTRAMPGSNTLAVDAQGDLWWVDDGHVLTLRAGEARPREAFADAALFFAVQGKDAVYLVGRAGVERLERSGTGVRRQPLPKGLPEPLSLRQVLHDGTQDWFLSGDRAWRLDQGRWVALQDEQGLPVRVERDGAMAGTGELWAVDAKGLSSYTLAAGVAHLERRVGAATLGGANIGFVRFDGERRVWVGTDRGVFVLAGGRWQRLDRDSGLLWNDIDDHAFLLDRDGSVWIGTSAGATHVQPGRLQSHPAVVKIEEIQFGDRTLRAAPAEPVEWDDRRLRMTLQTPDLGRGRSMRLEYRLQADAPWRPFEGNVLQLDSLEPDSYRLQVRAAARLPVDEPGRAVEAAFTIEPPWWKSVTARLVATAVLLMLWLLSIQLLRARAGATRRGLELAIAQRTAELERSREDVRMLGVHNARALEEERTRVARELHDEMGQQLAALRMEVSVLRMHERAGRPADDCAFGMLLQRVDGLVAGMRGVVSQLRPPALDAGLGAALEWLAAEFTRHAGVPCRVEVDACARNLPPETATMVFRIAQESLNNVRRHARATRVELTLREHGGCCELAVADDGMGFDVRGQRTGYGVLGMEERARALGGALSIESAPGSGTTVRLRIRTG